MKRVRLISIAAAALAALGGVSGFAYAERGSPATSAGAAQAAAVAAPVSEALQRELVAVVKRVAPSVVQIETSDGLGSGVVFDGKNDIVTNAHVVGSETTFTVTLPTGKRLRGTLVGTFVQNDLAVIRVPNAKLKPLPFADSSKLAVGDIAIAIGNPLGFQSSVTEGIISGLGRTVSEPNGVALPQAIQTSAAINPGNSGGALVDLRGRLVGIPTLGAASPGFGSQPTGIGFAIPSNTVRDIATQLVAHGKVVNSRRAYLGVRVGDTTGGSGVIVGEVTAGGPAGRAGVKAGDLIVSVGGKPTATAADLSEVMAGLRPGQKVGVVLRHADGTRSTVTVTLGEYPGS